MADRANHFGYGRRPALEGGERLFGSSGGEPFFRIGPCRGTVDHREEIDLVALGAERPIVEQMRRRAHPKLEGLRVGQSRQSRDGDNAAEPAGLRIDQPVITGDVTPRDRSHAVRRNDKIGLGGAAIRERRA